MESVILLDVPADDGEFAQSILEKLQHPVRVCHGPCGNGCPLLEGHECRLFARLTRWSSPSISIPDAMEPRPERGLAGSEKKEVAHARRGRLRVDVR